MPNGPAKVALPGPYAKASVSKGQDGPAEVLRGASSSLGMLKKGSCARPNVLRGASSNAKPLCPDGKVAQRGFWGGPSEGFEGPLCSGGMSRCQGGSAEVLRGATGSLGMLEKALPSPHAKPLCWDAKWPSEGCSTRPIRQSLCVQRARWPSGGFAGGKQQSWNAKKR